MSSFFWNVRGFNKPGKHAVVKDWLNKNSMKFWCILKTRVKEKKANMILSSVFSDWSSMTNYEHSQGGRIWLLWKDTVRMTPVYKTDQLITCSVALPGEEEFFCSFVYASNEVVGRKELWEDLCHHHNSPLFRNKEWLVMGDFNEILDGSEHSEFENLGRLSYGMRDFQQMVLSCQLMNMGYQGPLFTWCNKRAEGLVCKKLDRVLMNNEAMHRFASAYSVFEAGGCSDHMRCKIQVLQAEEKIKRPFKYVNAIGKLPNFLPMVKEYWESTDKLFHSTSTMHRFSKKLKSLKPLIRELGKEKLGNLCLRAKEALSILCEKQKITLSNPTPEAILVEAEAYEKWLHVADLEEDFLKQRSKLHWLDIGDQNNKNFHNAIKTRQAQNTLREIKCLDGRMATSHSDIKLEAERHFSSFLNHVPESFQGASVAELKCLLDFECNAEDCAGLEAEVTAEEIKQVLFSMPSNKSPGPDGYPSEFFKVTWPVLGQDFTVAVQSVFKFAFLPKGVNSTILALIPKKTDASEIKDYRPIACCNVLYKVVSKILANRLKGLLPRIITENQSAFIQGRLLMENVLLASELVKDYHKDAVSPRCMMKIDISKAFDSVQWSFLLRSLEAMGFPAKFIHWIKLCISTPSFSVQVNGDLAGYFQSARGLRQGCALSPYLFVLCMNVLSLKIDKASKEKKFRFHPRCQSLALTHLCFADDLMVFVEGSKESIEGVLSIFDEFATWSGLSISLEKSTVYMAGISAGERRMILTDSPLAVGELPVRYLGLPLMTKAMAKQDYLPLLEKIRTRICSWTSRFLSYAGRLQLLKSVIMSIVNFWNAVFRLPSQCIKDIAHLCSAFLWTGPELKTTGAKVAWRDICKPLKEGGLGIRDLKEVNLVYGLKLIWRMLVGGSLWGKWIKSNLLKKRNFWEVNEKSQGGSWMWKKMLKLRTVARNFHRKAVGNGSNTSFWFDNWSEWGVLADLLGDRGIIDLGIRREATVEEALNNTRRKHRHRRTILNDIEKGLESLRNRQGTAVMDIDLWRRESGFKPKFSTMETWKLTRVIVAQCSWARCVWFAQATPKFSFMTWLAIQNRLSTLDRISSWDQSVDTTCILCRNGQETRNYLFFECSFSSSIWKQLTKGILRNGFTDDWEALVRLFSTSTMGKQQLFCLKYAFQAVLYAVWRERNNRRHGEQAIPLQIMIKLTDKAIRNKLSILQSKGVEGYQGILQFWFASRL